MPTCNQFADILKVFKGDDNPLSSKGADKGIAIIDIEFTGLDNSFIIDNEIIQVKILNPSNNKSVIRNFNSKKPLSAHTQLEHGVVRYKDCSLFELEQFISMLAEIEMSIDADFYGFGVEQDKKMLAKYGCFVEIKDIRTHFQKTEFAYRMATEGSGLEETFFIVTGEFPPTTSHADLSELFLIEKLYQKMKETEANEYMSVVPFGHCSGMSIAYYVQVSRRAADGYRFNNSDEFSLALSKAIYELDHVNDFEEDENCN